MKSIVIYYHPKLPRRLISDDTAIWVGDEIVGYVRAELHKGKDSAEALDDAKPNENEIVLNSVELP